MLHSVAIIAVAAIVTLIIRAVPFVVFGGKREVPETVTYLGKVLPPAIMVILIYCVKEINLFTGSHGIPELLSIAVVALLHIWKKNTLLSIAVGTILYMILVQVVF
jgi:branched-subunit amino acid transport protein AzlD